MLVIGTLLASYQSRLMGMDAPIFGGLEIVKKPLLLVWERECWGGMDRWGEGKWGREGTTRMGRLRVYLHVALISLTKRQDQNRYVQDSDSSYDL